MGARGDEERLLDGSSLGLGWSQRDVDDVVAREVISHVELILGDLAPQLTTLESASAVEADARPDAHSESSNGAAYPFGIKPSAVHIEVEGRLGVLLDPFSNERLKLPIETEALLSTSSPNLFGYKFASSLSSHHFECFKRTLAQELGLTEADGGLRRQACSQENPIVTRDVFLAGEGDNGEDNAIRVSFDPQNNQIIEAIRKEPAVKLNVFTGKDVHEEEVELLINESGEIVPEDMRTAVDFRISVNKEIMIPVDQLVACGALNQKRLHQRHRVRTSFPLFGYYRVDTTVVSTGKPGQSAAYEVELEINPHLLYLHFMKKQQNDPTNRFDAIILNFIQILRAWCAFLNTSASAELLSLQKRPQQNTSASFGADLTDCAVSPKTLEKYLTRVCPVVPLIGDYAFRFLTGHCNLLPEVQKLSKDDIADSVRLTFNQEELKALQERKRRFQPQLIG